MEDKYEFLSDNISCQFLKLWALTTFGQESEFEDDLFSFCAFDGI